MLPMPEPKHLHPAHTHLFTNQKQQQQQQQPPQQQRQLVSTLPWPGRA